MSLAIVTMETVEITKNLWSIKSLDKEIGTIKYDKELKRGLFRLSRRGAIGKDTTRKILQELERFDKQVQE